MNTKRKTMGFGNNIGSVKILPMCLLLGLALVFPACVKVSTGPVPVAPQGTYQLVSVDEALLPATVSHGEAKIRIMSGNFTFHEGAKCTSEIQMIAPGGQPVNRVVHATYTQHQDTLKMKWEGAGTTQGTVEDNFFTMNNEGMVFLYRKSMGGDVEPQP